MSETEERISEELKFVYRKELWFANLLINSTRIDISQVIKDLENLLKTKLKNLRKSDIPNCAWSEDVQNSVIEIAKHIKFTINWNAVLFDFPYQINQITYNNAGYLEFDVEYYKDDLEGKRKLKPWILHEVPIFILNELKKFCGKIDYIAVDKDPMYIIAIADRTEERGLRVEVPWIKKEMDKHKKCISEWVSLYSGRWDDFRSEFLEDVVKTNLALRKSELHYIRDASAFFYIAESDFNEYFESYYKKRVIKTIGEIRAFQHAIIEINRAVDELKTNINTAAYFKLDLVTKTLNKLQYLVGGVDSKISEIKNDLESNRYRYYKKILAHLIDIMNIEYLSDLLQLKIRQISSSLQTRYQKIQQDSQDQMQKSTYYLTIFFGLGFLTDIIALTVTFFGTLFGESETSRLITLWISGILGSISLLLMVIFGFRLIKINRQKLRKEPMRTVDAVIVDEKERILLVKRKFPPFQGAYALPGGFTELAEQQDEAIVREAREETGIDLNYGEYEYIGVFDKRGRDPRGPVHTHAYLIRIPDIEKRMGDFSDVEDLVIFNIADLKGIDLAFDHRDIIHKALKK